MTTLGVSFERARFLDEMSREALSSSNTSVHGTSRHCAAPQEPVAIGPMRTSVRLGGKSPIANDPQQTSGRSLDFGTGRVSHQMG
jgi:hypothetical protein